MEQPQEFLKNLAIVLCVAAVTTIVFQKLRQPVVLGYLLAGMIIGPHIPIPLVADAGTVRTLSELGVILLMFWLGLEFRFRKLFRAGSTVGVIALIECSFMVWVGNLLGLLLGWSALESLFAGAIVAISSTMVVMKTFEENAVRGKLSETVFGVLIYEDLIAIFLLAVLTTLSAGKDLSAQGLALTAGKLAAFLGGLSFVGLFLLPPFVRAVVRLNRPETTLVACVGICFAAALLARHFGYSVALGAFLAGSFIGESGENAKIEPLVRPVRDIFGAIFFVAVGMTIDPRLIAEHGFVVLAFCLLVALGKLFGVSVAGFLTGHGTRLSLQTGMSLAQIGEFSFILAGLALGTTERGELLFALAVSVSAITTLLTPWLIRHSEPAAAYLDEKLPKPVQTFSSLYGAWLERLQSAPPETLAARARRWVRFLLLDSLILVFVVIGTSVSLPWLTGPLVSKAGWSPQLARWAGIGAAVVLCAPFAVGIFRCVRSLGFALAARALPAAGEGAVDLAAAPRRAFVVILQLAILLVVAAPLLAITQPFLPAYPGPALLVLLLGLLGLAFWRRAASLQGHVSAGAAMIAEALAKQRRGEPAPADGSDPLALVRSVLPGLGDLVPVRLEPGSPAVGKTLSELRLRGVTGASVLAIARGGESVIVPKGNDALREGDVLALTGTHEATEAARELLLSGKEPR